MELELGKTYQVAVKYIIKLGAVVELPDGCTELIHISNISNQFVDDARKFVKPGKTYIATCVTGKARPLELSFKALDLKPIESYEHGTINPKQKTNKSKSLNIIDEKDNLDASQTTSSLDDMIIKANLVYQDKIKDYTNHRYNKRRNR